MTTESGSNTISFTENLGDSVTINPVDVPEVVSEEPKEDPNAKLRAHNDRLVADNKALRGELLSDRLTQIGLSPNEGLGKAIAKEYDGDLSVDAVSAYAANEYSYQGQGSVAPPEIEAGDRLDTLGSEAESVTPPPPVVPGEVEVNRVDGNDPEAGREEAQTSLAAKTSQFYREHYG